MDMSTAIFAVLFKMRARVRENGLNRIKNGSFVVMAKTK